MGPGNMYSSEQRTFFCAPTNLKKIFLKQRPHPVM
jgi:hypothetical protein